MIAMLDAIGLLSAWFMHLPRWVMLSLYGLMLTYSIAAGGFVLARAGIKPLWVLLLLMPNLNIVALWLWGFGRWPREQQRN